MAKKSTAAKTFFLVLALAAAAGFQTYFTGTALAQIKLQAETLGAPSTSIWMVAVMQAKRFDLKNGVDVEWVEKPSVAVVYNDFAAGVSQVTTGGIMSLANQYARGVKAKLFATYQLFGTSVIVNTERAPNLKSLKELNGMEIAAPLASENYKAMTLYLQWGGVDIKSLKTRNFDQPGVIAELNSPTGSAVAGVVFAQVPTKLVMDNPKKFKDLISESELEKMWRQETGTDHHWLLGWAAQEDFASHNREALQRLHNAMKETIEWFNDHTEEALKIIAKKINAPVPVLRETVKAGRVKFMQTTTESQEKAILKLLTIATKAGYVLKSPDANFFYHGLH